MANLECVNLTLKTTSINASTTYSDYLNTTIATSTGVISNNRNTMTWYNVNLRNLLGIMYNKYNAFNICLNSYAMSTNGTSTVLNDNATLHVYLSGLSFLSSDNQATGISNNTVVLRQLKIPTGPSLTDNQTFSDKVYFTFLKNCDNVNLTIELKTVATNTYPNVSGVANNLQGHMTFNFSIYGVEEHRVLKK